ncbi:hypothetical protein [Brevibacterium samyangense]|uniref:Helix-turn-helix domain-containing protein n=1 Tax=Brevibacterium samyangense TaxID=366888 RepID=A0ABN2TN85_9MICO
MPTNESPLELATVFGQNFMHARHEIGATLDQVAKEARLHGARWTASRVKNLESGNMAPTVPNLCTAAWVLTSLDETASWTVAGLISTDDPDDFVRIGELDVRNRFVVETLTGETLRPLGAGDYRGGVEEAEGVIGEMLDTFREYGPNVTAEQFRIAEASIGLADKRAAKRLGVNVRAVAGAALRRWGNTLSVEVEKQSAPDASAQAKGHITRRLTEELRADVEALGVRNADGDDH